MLIGDWGLSHGCWDPSPTSTRHTALLCTTHSLPLTLTMNLGSRGLWDDAGVMACVHTRVTAWFVGTLK